ncbi:MAG: alanine--tRNA ligase [Pseudomonadales bacterium]
MKSADLREAFLTYFERKGHTRVASSSLVPHNDATLLFTNAGMVQFKDVFLGAEQRDFVRAVSSQRCVRAGGKHNDLENVGYTARHHTFFEMLGNFSFGDYFKREAIQFAWEFLTVEMQLPAEKLWVTVYEDDQEAEDIWLKEMQVDAGRFTRLGADSNFWSMGDTGPCGPCSEIFYDHGDAVSGGPPGSPDEDGDRYVEIWNLVFMQFDRDANGAMQALPKPSVDTGMGLERIAAVMQGVHSNYDIDLFQSLLRAAAAATGAGDIGDASLKVIADHIRSCAFLIADGVIPGNEGRGYVLRRIIRRAIRHGHKLGAQQVFFHKLVQPLATEMGAAYPELVAQHQQIEKVLLNEEEQFAKTLEHGMRILEQDLAQLSGREISGATAFKLYDTYGFPLDLTADIARERDLSVDVEGFETCMEAQRERARSAGSFAADYGQALTLDGETEFIGYERLHESATVVALFKDGQAVDQLGTEQGGQLVLDRTPFYAESGGQVGDTGHLSSDTAKFEVLDTRKQQAHHVHHGNVLSGSVKVGDTLTATVDAALRQATALNHSATHLLHAALRTVLGEHVSQKGSLVDAEHLRFDFAHFEAVTTQQLEKIENRVNAEIRRNTQVETESMAIDDAMAKGAIALFGEKYGDDVRVLTMGQGFSVELCGGTHVQRTGDIGLLHIVAESGIAAGVRRIEALTGAAALQHLRGMETVLENVGQLLKADRDSVTGKLQQLLQAQKQTDKELNQLKSKLASNKGGDLLTKVQEVNGVQVLAASVEGVDAKALRTMLDQLKDKLRSGVVALGSVQDDKVALVAGVTSDLSDKLPAGQLMQSLAAQVGGKGGGRADMAQGGGTDSAALPAAMATVSDWVTARLA